MTIKVVSIMSVFNEDDIISQSIGHLIEQGIEVYLLDNCSTDNTIEEASKWLGKGLLHIEKFPDDAGYPNENQKSFILQDILKRKEEIAQEIKADWFINSDVDEFQFSPWENLNLNQAIEFVDELGFNAINHKRLEFQPVNNEFRPGSDVMSHIKYFTPQPIFCGPPLVRIWKNQNAPVHLARSGGHLTEFPGALRAPIRFLMLHYCIRSQTHGEQKIFKERLNRFSKYEKDELKMHPHYNTYLKNESILKRVDDLELFDLNRERAKLLSEFSKNLLYFNKINQVSYNFFDLTPKELNTFINKNYTDVEFDKILSRFLSISGVSQEVLEPEENFDLNHINDYRAIIEIYLMKVNLGQNIDL
ncbi:MAG: glycosyltransferase family 2 protein, partial [Fibrobacteria bacterium]|nr:glycosyltransferase family 2 protein [Fibrobacteria bacterium]